MKIYPVKYKRTPDWWDGHWADVSNWCTSTFGKNHWAWSHVAEEFLFEKASDRLMFILRWK